MKRRNKNLNKMHIFKAPVTFQKDWPKTVGGVGDTRYLLPIHTCICSRATENRFFAGSDRFLVCKTDSICIKRIFFGPKKTHFADHILAQFPGLVKCQTVNCP